MTTSILLFLLYLVWGLFSFLTQGNDRIRKKFKAIDPLGLIPNYRFFCPNPIRTDYHLYYRVRHADTSLAEWKEIVVGKRSPYIGFLWNPLKRDRKILYKTVKILRNPAKKRAEEPVYQALIDWIHTNYARQPGHAIQLRITSRQDLAPGSIEKEIHVSVFHSVKPRHDAALSN